MRFYQLGGFNSHLRDWRDVPQGHTLVRKTGEIELILGIKHSGAWYILISENDLPRSVRCDRPPYLSTEFASLSPITFTSLKQIEDKLKALRQDSRKNKKNRIHDQSKRDTSEANNRYSLGANGLRPARVIYGKDIRDSLYVTITSEDASCQRSAFEHSRVILRALRRTLRVSKFIIGDSLWNGLVNRFIIFASTPSSPAASGLKRVPLDIAWAEVSFSEAGTELFSRKNRFLTPDAALYWPSKTSEGDEPHSRSTDFDGQSLRTFFSLETHKMHEGTGPTIILVYDAVFAFMVLGEAGVDTTNWELGATSLLVQTSPRPMPRNAHGRDSLVARSRRPADSRSRSRSPPTNREHHSNCSSSRHRPASPSHRMSLAPVYVIDIQSLWLTMPGMSRPAPSLLDMAHRLTLDSSAGSSFGAGNDLDLMYKVWTSLVGAAPIDDKITAIHPGPLPSLGPTANSAGSNPVGKTRENAEDEDDATSPGKVARAEATQPIVDEDPYSAFEEWAGEDEDLDD